MRFKDYGRKPKLRKVYVQSKGLLIVAVDIGKTTHTACFGTQKAVISHKFAFNHNRYGFSTFEKHIRSLRLKSKCKRFLVGMEPSGLYWYALYKQQWFPDGFYSLSGFRCNIQVIIFF
ncbi:MAG: hypothetical protein JJV98_18245 [Desulfosarcina sp.]|nr:hypothetical protein [Desulfobacterales bacterium]